MTLLRNPLFCISSFVNSIMDIIHARLKIAGAFAKEWRK